MKKWYVATVKPNADLLAAKHLREQSYPVYVAKTFDQVRDGRRFEPVGRLRLPGYIFVAFDKGEHGPINHTRGVGALLLDGNGDPEPIRSRVIETLRALEDADFDEARANAEMKERTDLREWDEVIIEGPDHLCRGQKGYFMESNKGEAKVLIGMTTWPVNVFDLRKVEKPKKEKPEKTAKKRKKGKQSGRKVA